MLDILFWSSTMVQRKRKVNMNNIQLIDPRKDFDGNDLKVGDTVAFLVPHDRRIGKGEVIDFTKQMIRIKTGVAKNWRTGEDYIQSELREPRAVVKYKVEYNAD